MPDWIQQFKDYFSFSKSERGGILVLLFLLVILILFNILLPIFVPDEPMDFKEFEAEIIAFEKRQNQIHDSINRSYKIRSEKGLAAENKIKPFNFDPNKLPRKKWLELGFEEWQIDVIKNYENKGGTFRSKEDVAKIYSISEEEYQIIEPYISISGEHKIADKEETTLNPFPFDPNTISKEKFLEMGLPERAVNAIINYREKGGRFFEKDDFKKIYNLSNEAYLILEPYIEIETLVEFSDSLKRKKTEILSIELNSADTLDLQQLSGIGPSFSRRIVKYRELLGGYCRKEQLLEVYGMDSLRFHGMVSNIEINDANITKININKATIKEMIKHPYIEYYLAKSIITYREKIGGYHNLEELKDAKLIYEELFQKIKPYLSLTDYN